MNGKQLQLVTVPVDERRLSDVARAVFEAIQAEGRISPHAAGRIVYRFRGYESTVAVPKQWLVSAGVSVLHTLRRAGFVTRAKGEWVRERQP